MMKRITAVLLGIMMLCTAFAAAESLEEKVTLGTISINGAFTLQCGLPEGYTPTPVRAAQDQIIAVIRSEDPNAPIMTLSVAFDETYSDVERMNDLDSEALTLLEQTYIEQDPYVEITYGETGYGTLLMIARHESETLDYVAFLSVYKGYFIEFVLTPSETAQDRNLTEEQLRISIKFLTDLDFIPAAIPVNGTFKPAAGQEYLAELSDYNAENNSVKVALKRAIVLDPAEVNTLKPGDTLTLGEEIIVAETIEQDDDGVIILNGEYILRSGDAGINAYFYEHEYTETIALLTCALPEGLVFRDGINPDSGEILDTPKEHTAEEFAGMLAAGSNVDFASDNVYVTFDENGELSLVERFYTPWQ